MHYIYMQVMSLAFLTKLPCEEAEVNQICYFSNLS